MVALSHADELAWLLQRAARAEADGHRVSLYMPVQRVGQQVRQDFIRYKNLLVRAEEQLVAAGVRRPVARDHLEPARVLGEDGDFWLRRGLGLAVFIEDVGGTADNLRLFDLPYAVAEQVHVGEQFVLRPLLRRYCLPGTVNRHSYVLVLSQNKIQLYESEHDHLAAVEVPHAPHGLEELQAFIDAEKSLQFHSGTGETMSAAPVSGGAARRAIFHGHGSDDTRENKRVLELMRLLDDALRPVLVRTGERAPLIPVGVEWVVNQFRQVSTYRYITQRHVHGSTRHRTQHELFEEAREIADEVFEQETQAALDLYAQQRGTRGVTTDLERAVSMSMMGQVHSLLVVLDAASEQWGTSDPVTYQVTLHRKRQPGDQDLLELAMLHTLQHGGDVMVLPRERMPESASVAAVLRRGAVAMRG